MQNNMEVNKSLLVLIVIACFALLPLQSFANLKNIAFYYNTSAAMPLQRLGLYDAVVVMPHHGFKPQQLSDHKTQVFAYISVGEALAAQNRNIPKQFIIGNNKTWAQPIVDLANPAWRNYFIQNVVVPLWRQGYRGFFLDTLDSYRLAVKDSAGQKQQQAGLVSLIKNIKHRYPNAKLILNRGFEIIPQVKSLISAVAAESLYQQWNQNTKQYQAVSSSARDWLLAKLKQLQQQHITVIVIDYALLHASKQAQQLADKIAALNFIPYVTTGDLQQLGYSELRLKPRKILLMYDGQYQPLAEQSMVFNYVAMPLEYMGYNTELRDIWQKLPRKLASNNYAGIVLWMDRPAAPAKFANWIKTQISDGIPVAIMGAWPFSQKFMNKYLAINWQQQLTVSSVHIIKHNPNVGFEAKPIANHLEFSKIMPKQATSWLTVQTDTGIKSTPIAITNWGGYATRPYLLRQLPNNQQRWIVNPFAFLQAALKLQSLPVADVTTENGRRLLMSHIDGDGFISKAEWPNGPIAGQVMYKHVLQHYSLPISVSIIEGELSPPGIKPQQAELYKSWAQKIFALPNVEIASHTYSHPYDWGRSVTKPLPDNTPAQYSAAWHLPLQDYKFNLDREISGSVNFINQYLAPINKKCKIYFWSGNANPPWQALQKLQQLHLQNINGGDTRITASHPSLTFVSPMAINKHGYTQVYAPETNENIYTNLWTGPFWGFQRVIETFKMTNEPRRLKPVDIYYHFYSATKKASLAALDKVYSWAMQQDLFPVYISSYIKIVDDFQHLAVAHEGKDWVISTDGNLRELRVPIAYGYPDFYHSKNIVGFWQQGNKLYIHLGPTKTSTLVFQASNPLQAYLARSNGKLLSFSRNRASINMQLFSHFPLEFTLANTARCQVRADGKVIHAVADSKLKTMQQQLQHFKLTKAEQHVISVSCQTNHQA